MRKSLSVLFSAILMTTSVTAALSFDIEVCRGTSLYKKPIECSNRSFFGYCKASRTAVEKSISKPNASTVWSHGETRALMEWNGLEGILVKVDLFKTGVRVAELSGWTDNEGSIRCPVSVDPAWGSGMDFQIRVQDNLGAEFWSETFRIASDMRIVSPSSSSRWATGEGGVRVAWTGQQGSMVRIVLKLQEVEVARVTDWEQAENEYVIPYPVPPSWGVGSGYSLEIEDDLGNGASSSPFTILPILVTEPGPDTHWRVGESIPAFEWSGAHTVVRIELHKNNNRVAEISSWIDDTGSCEMQNPVPAGWMSGHGGQYDVVVIDDLGNVGIGGPVVISISDDTPAGAVPLSGTASGFVSDSLDVDYWSVSTQSGNTYRVLATGDALVNLQVFRENGVTSVKGPTLGEIAWRADRNGTCYIKVSPEQGSIGGYALEFTRSFGVIDP